jgi:hypothetical protein
MLVEGKCQRTMRGKPQAQPEFLTTINLNHIKSGPMFMLLTPWNDSWKLYYEADSTQNHWQA